MKFKRLNIYEYHKHYNKVEYLLQAQEYEKKVILSSNEELSKFVEFAGNNYMYTSEQLLSQYHFNSKAIAMTTYDEWIKVGRVVKRGRKHIPILVKEENGSLKVDKVFDISDTVETNIEGLRFERWEYEEKYVDKSYIKEKVEKELLHLDDTNENKAIKYFVYRFVDARTNLKYLREFDDYKKLLDEIPVQYVKENFFDVLDKSLKISTIILDDINNIIDNYKNNELENKKHIDNDVVTNIKNVFKTNDIEILNKDEFLFDNGKRINKDEVFKLIGDKNLKELSIIVNDTNLSLEDRYNIIGEKLELIFYGLVKDSKVLNDNKVLQEYILEYVLKQLNLPHNQHLAKEVEDNFKNIDIDKKVKELFNSPLISSLSVKVNKKDFDNDNLKQIFKDYKWDDGKNFKEFNPFTEDKYVSDLIVLNFFRNSNGEYRVIYNYADSLIYESNVKGFLEDIEDKTKDKVYQKVAIKVGTEFILIPTNDYKIIDIDINDTNTKVIVDNTIYPLYAGSTFKESTKIDSLIDSGHYNSFKVNDYLIGNSIEEKNTDIQNSLLELSIEKEEVENENFLYDNQDKQIIEDTKNIQESFELESEIYDIVEEINSFEKNYKITEEVQAEKLKPSERLLNNLNAIKLLKELEKDNRILNNEEKKVLVNYVGWGGLADVFDESKKGQWEVARDELKSLLTNEEYRKASESTLTAFYTPKYIIDGIYKALENFGFNGGKILEPSCATGNFIGNLPTSMSNSKFYGVELDSISGKIAKKLYPEADIKIGGYEESTYKNNTFDVAIGNIPFGNYKVFDKEYNSKNLLIHDYFFAKTIDKVRPGGIISFITSTGTLDKKNNEFRKYISERCDLIGAIRLPSGVFKGVAGTEVASDVIFLQKKEKLEVNEPSWLNSINVVQDGNKIYNNYFVENREKLLAEVKSGGYMGENDYIFKDYGENDNLEAFKKDYITQINSLTANYREVNINNATLGLGIDIDLYKNYSFFNYENNIYYNENYNVVVPDLNEKEKIKVKNYITLDNALKELIQIQKENCTDEELSKCQEKLTIIYNNFVSKHGNINSKQNEKFFKDDSNYFLLSTLEKVDDRDRYKVIGISDIFTKRTIRSDIEVVSVDNSKDALILSLNNYAGVNLQYISKLTNKDVHEVIEDLKDEIYLNVDEEFLSTISIQNLNPLKEYSSYIVKDEFLTGNIKNKIDNVDKLLNMINYNINIGNDFERYKIIFEEYKEKLLSVLPKKIEAGDIDAKIGANWIPIKYYNEFILENFTPNFRSYYCEVKYSRYTASWKIENKKFENDNTTKWFGTDKITAGELFEDLLNLKASKVMAKKFENGQEISYVDQKETFLAQQKQEEIKFKFKEWIFSDKGRRDDLVEIYNNKFNTTVSRNYDGSNLTFSGMNPEVNLREHQKNAIARTLFGGNSLLAHVVGAGKTYEMVASAMESKRIGLASKSMFVVPNHLTEQIGREFLDLYPSANILIATKKDFEPDNRKKFTGKIATGEYDAVIIGHTQFEKIPLSKERRIHYIQSEINNLTEITNSSSDKFTTKEIEKAKKRLSNKLTKLIESKEKDDVLNFEDLGIDKLYVDEAHSFKNLYTPTKLNNISGISQTEAMKSSDMYMKCSYMNEKTNYKGVVFATGTAISNTMVEMFTMQRYLQGDKLEELGLSNFDDWIAAFGEIKNSMELSPTGTGYQVKTRLANFSNLPELVTIFKECADVKTKDDLDLPIPKANYHTVITKVSDEQKEILETFVERAERVKTRSVDPTEDNMLKITNDGKKLALDIRLFNPNADDLPGSKVNKCVDNVLNIYKETEEAKSTQVIFCDMSTPNKEFNLYDDIREKLINKGVKAEEIAFIHEAKNETQKTSMFEKVKKGEIRILLGSTAKMGAGTNIQNKLIALHDLDVPWRPSDLEQRAGRIVRQGNENKEVNIYRYVTENTFDSYLWQTIENKQRFISQVLTSKEIGRVSEDIDEVTLDYAEIKALATGNPLIKEKMQVDLEVQKLKMMYANYNKNIYKLEDDIKNYYPREIKRLENSIFKLEKDLNLYSSNSVKNTFIVLDKEYSDLKEAEKTMIKYIKDKGIVSPTKVAEYKGFDIIVSHNLMKGTYECKLKGVNEYSVNVAFSKSDVNIGRMKEKLDSIGEILNSYKDRLNSVKSTLLDAKEKVSLPFERKEDLKTLINRQTELNYIFNNGNEDRER